MVGSVRHGGGKAAGAMGIGGVDYDGYDE